MRLHSFAFPVLLAALSMLAPWRADVVAADAPSDYTLSNGLRVRLVPMAGEKEVAVLLGVRAGIFDEPAGFPHLAHVAEHLVVFGSPAGSVEGKAVARWYEAGKANAETLPGLTYFDLWVEPTELGAALRVQAARLARPEFSDALLTREIPRTLAEVEYVENSVTSGTGKFAFSAFVQAAVHGRTEVPIKAVTRRITVEDVRRFHARHFRPDRAMLVLAGGFEPTVAKQLIEETCGTIAVPATTPDRFPVLKIDGPVDARWDAATRHLILAWRTPPASDPDHAALTLASIALAERLPFDRDISALGKMPIVSNEVEGFFVVNVQAKPGADPNDLKARLIDQVRRLATPEGFDDARVDQARRQFSQTLNPSPLRMFAFAVRSSPLMARTNVELQRMVRAIVWGDLDSYSKRVEGLDGTAVRDAVGRVLNPDRALVIRVEPMK